MAGVRHLEDWEVEKFLTTVKDEFTWQTGLRYWCMFALQFATGLRASEVRTLRIKDVTVDGKKASKFVRVQKCNTKRKKENREIPASPMAIRAIETWLDFREGELTDIFFSTNTVGGDRVNQRLGFTNKTIHLTTYVNAFERVAKAAGLEPPIASHSARKTFAMKFYAASDNSLIATSKALGHSDVGTTIAYLEVDKGMVNDTILTLFQ